MCSRLYAACTGLWFVEYIKCCLFRFILVPCGWESQQVLLFIRLYIDLFGRENVSLALRHKALIFICVLGLLTIL